ncbi:MAG: NosD domain-containing protein, partial [Candidatus Bathyarchaeota archaeon]|nr:NosD domain-containing protein [Candidatus Bathyarchaeota archaeon]
TAANSGDSIYVLEGTYYECLTITKNNLKLIGENPNTTIIDGNYTGTVINLLADNITIAGFTIRRSGDNEEGLCLDHANNNIIINNTYYDCHVGILLKNSGGNKIIRNILSNNSLGIILAVNSTQNVISENVIILNNQGIDLRAYTSNNILSNNTITNNWYSGVYLSLSKENIITENIVRQNRNGFYLYGFLSTKNNITCNEIANNNEGIHIFQSSNNIFYHNNFINNTCQVYFEDSSANIWDNGEEGNYWSDYNGKDADNNGIGDAPYVINFNNQDNYPLMYLWRCEKPHVEGSPYIIEVILLTASFLVVLGIVIYIRKLKKLVANSKRISSVHQVFLKLCFRNFFANKNNRMATPAANKTNTIT